MNSKSKAFTLHSSSSLSNIFKRAAPSLEANITNKLHRAQQKLLEIIGDVMQTAKEAGHRKTDNFNTAHYLTLEQYKTAVWASKTLNEVDVLLKSTKSKKYLDKKLKTQFDFESAKVRVNKHGKIFVDTAILVQLMDLHNVLGKMMDHLRECSSEGVSDPFNTETEVSLDSDLNADRKLTELLAELDSNSGSTNTKSTKEILTALSLPLHNKFVVMPAGGNDLPPLSEEQISESREDFDDTRKTKSTSSFKHNEVTDAVGARRIIIRCLSDLDKVKHYLYTIDHEMDLHPPREDTGNAAEEPPIDEEDEILAADLLEDDRRETSDEEAEEREPRREQSLGQAREPSRTLTREPSLGKAREPSRVLAREPSLGKAHRDQSKTLAREPSRERRSEVRMTESEKKKCCCLEDCPADEPLEFTWKEGDETSSKLVICIKGKTEEDGDVHVVIRQCPECQLIGKVDLQGRDQPGHHDLPRDPSHAIVPPLAREQSHTRAPSKEKSKNYESDILHGKEPAADCPLSSSEDVPHGAGSKTEVNVIFDPQDPSNSKVERRRSSQHHKRHLRIEEKMSRIQLNETVNLNLQTDQGQDLVISLTVRPRAEGPANLSITDIFSESRTNVPERDRKKSFQEAERGPSERGIHKSSSRIDPSHEDVTIPLSRTKVCSSLEFDVQVVESRMKSSGIKHTNPNIVVRLTDMGVNNLLRACRPVKCGRKAILNENLRKCLPYSPSLESLPLEELDADIIDQSLDMSIKKSKHSTIFIRDDKLTYNVEVSSRKASGGGPVKQVYFVQVSSSPVGFENSSSRFGELQGESSMDILLRFCSNDGRPKIDKWLRLEEWWAAKNSVEVFSRKDVITCSRQFWAESFLGYYISLGSSEASSFSSSDKTPRTEELRAKKHYQEVSNTKNIITCNSQFWVKHLLAYYINLVEDLTFNCSSVIEVRYFEIENIQKRKDDKVPATILRVRLKKNESLLEGTGRQSEIGKVVQETAREEKNRSRFPSRIPVYKSRYGGCKNVVKSRAPQTKKTGNRNPPLEKKVEGSPTDSQKLNSAVVQKQENKNALQVTQGRSILTIHSKDASTNSSNAGIFSNETAEYFNKFMRYISLLNGASAAAKHQQRKKKEFYTSRSHSLILINPGKVTECPEKDARANTRLSRKRPRDTDADAMVKKGILLNDVILSSTRFKKKLNYEKTTSRIVINRLSNFLYENFIEGVSAKTRVELLNKIDQLLSVYSGCQTKNETLRGRRDAQ